MNRALAPLLPLDVQIVQDSKENVLERLPELLADEELSANVVSALITAFNEGQALVNAIHDAK